MKNRQISILIITSLLFLLLCGTNFTFADAEMTPSGIPLDDLEIVVDNYVADYIGSTVPGATIAIVKNGEIIFSKGYGYSDVTNEIVVKSNKTIFEWGSITKIFTWTAAMQLSEQGLIDLDADVRQYLPESFLNHWEFEQTITMRNLMNHTAGFGDYGFDLIYDSPEQLSSLENELIKADPKQYYEVGTASAYSNYGTALAGLIIENVSGMDYDTYLDKNIFKKLEMVSSTSDRSFNVEEALKQNKSKAYKPLGETGYEETIWSYVGLGPAGSLNGTVEDLAQFAIALMPKKGEETPIFENNQTLDALLTPSYMLTANGFFEFDGAYQSFGHGGNTAGFTGQFAIVPEEEFAVITLTNVKGETNIGYGIQEMLIGKKEYAKIADIQSDVLSEMPNAKTVEGQYVPLRRFEGSFLEVLSYLAPASVVSEKNNEITVSLGGTFEANYVQVEPYLYKITGRDIPLFNMAMPIIEFEMEDGHVKQMATGHGFDHEPIQKSKGKTIQLLSLIVIVINILLILVYAVLSIIRILKAKGSRSVISKTYKRVTLLNLALLANNITCFSMFMINSFRNFESMKPFIFMNYILLLVYAGFLILMAVNKKEKKLENQQTNKGVHFLTYLNLTSIAFLFIVLNHWNFFVIH